MRQVPLFRRIARKLVRVLCRIQLEPGEVFPHEWVRTPSADCVKQG
jgi:hypothetical protein